ncbi:MAG: alanyl-tRNA editing protein [Candidatus Eisenbacteria bacterium]
MGSERLYYDDSYTTKFEARVIATGAHAGRPAVELETTYFFPESGGQEADRGRLGDARVADVQADDDGRVWHVLAGDGAGSDGKALEGSASAGPLAAAKLAAGSDSAGPLTAEVDWARRFDHMQQHTGQHMLSAAFERELGVATLSSHLGEERSSIELALPDADWRTLDRVEEAANRVIWENRPVRLHWTDDRGVAGFALRKPPKVSGRIRIVEIPDWDVSACGGTHTRATGEIGAIKIVRWEKVRGNARLEFLCGRRALSDHAWRTEALLEAAKRRTLKDRDLIAHLERAAEERDVLARRLDELTDRVLLAEARERVGDPPRGVADLSPARPRDEVRRFALKCLVAGAPWAIAAATAPEPTIVVARAKGPGPDLKPLAEELRAIGGGKGGGGADYLQIAAADGPRTEAAFRRAQEFLAAPQKD